MIGRNDGLLIEKNPPEVLVEAGGVGYEIAVPMSTFCNLPVVGERVVLLTHLAVREDAHQLFGFLTAAERQAFRELIRIAGIGNRTALAVLSGMSVDDLAEAVVLQESGRLTRIPGIGKKTAERLLLELKGKLGAALGAAAKDTGAAAESGTDVLRALVALGYSEKEAAVAVRQLPPATGVSEGIRLALKSLARA
jgi:Holliday junction DNA helicase RuvA